MGFLKKIVLISLMVVLIAIIVQRLIREPKNHHQVEWKNFGGLSDEKAKSIQKDDPEPFKIEVTDEDESYLRQRLQTARLPPALTEEVNMTYGYPSSGVEGLRQELLQFDLKKWAQKLNGFNHYKRTLYGLEIHYIKVSAKKGLRRIPLLLSHGWPGSVYEFYDAVPLLQSKAEKSGFSFDIIIPSIPGYGWSEPSGKPGCTPKYVAAIFAELMKLEFPGQKYIVQGGDWGSLISEWVVGLYPERVLGIHLNMFAPPEAQHDLRVIPYQIILSMAPSKFLSEIEVTLLQKHGFYGGLWWVIVEGGYFHLQATKPDTLGAALTDSPLGLATYIMEKFYTWTDSDTLSKPLLEATKSLPYSVEKALDNIMIYWHSNTITSSMRLYKEAIQEIGVPPFETTDVPSGVLMNSHEISFVTRPIAELKFTNLKRYTASLKGGHFAAFEEPEKYSTEVVEFAKTLL